MTQNHTTLVGGNYVVATNNGGVNYFSLVSLIGGQGDTLSSAPGVTGAPEHYSIEIGSGNLANCALSFKFQ